MTDLESLKSKIDALSPPEKLRLAADLLENGKAQLAYTIAEQASLELGAALVLGVEVPGA